MRIKTTFAVLVLATAIHARGAATAEDFARKFSKQTILVIQIDTKSACPVPIPCRAHVTGHIVKVVNDPGQQGRLTAGFDANILQQRPGMGDTGWSTTFTDVGEQYVVGSKPDRPLPETIEVPEWVARVKDQEELVGDLDLILGSAPLPLAARIATLSAALTSPGRRGGPVLAGYLVALLAESDDRDAEAVSEAVEDGGTDSLSTAGKNALLGSLWQEVRERRMPPVILLRLLVRVTMAYLVDAPASPRVDEPDLRLQIVRNQLPWILNSEEATAVLQNELASVSKDRLRRRAQESEEWDAPPFSAVDRRVLTRLAVLMGGTPR